MSTSRLPTPRTVLTALLTSLSAQSAFILQDQQPQVTNSLQEAPPFLKSLFLTLHVLFPNEFLPALDVLDRRLITRFRLNEDEDDQKANTAHNSSLTSDTTRHNQEQQSDDYPWEKLYFVRSAQQPSSHSHHGSSRYTNPLTAHYEVRSLAWNCSCPAFAFSAFPAPPATAFAPGFAHSPTPALANRDTDNASWSFGGLSLAEAGVPVCKHLLACVLVERCPVLFGASVEEKIVDKEDWAGWCAGWGG